MEQGRLHVAVAQISSMPCLLSLNSRWTTLTSGLPRILADNSDDEISVKKFRREEATFGAFIIHKITSIQKIYSNIVTKEFLLMYASVFILKMKKTKRELNVKDINKIDEEKIFLSNRLIR